MTSHIIMLVGAKVCDLTEDLLWFVCGLYVGILTSSLMLQFPLAGHCFQARVWTEVCEVVRGSQLSGLANTATI